MRVVCSRCDSLVKPEKLGVLRCCPNCKLVLLSKKELKWITDWRMWCPDAFIKAMRVENVFGLMFPYGRCVLMVTEMKDLFLTGKYWQWKTCMKCGKEEKLLYKEKEGDKIVYVCEECVKEFLNKAFKEVRELINNITKT